MNTYKKHCTECANAIGMMQRNSGSICFDVNGKRYVGAVFEVNESKPLSLLTKNTIDEYIKVIKEVINREAYVGSLTGYEKVCMAKEPIKQSAEIKAMQNDIISNSENIEKILHSRDEKMNSEKHIMSKDVDNISKILELHKKWINDEIGGVRADLRKANLSGADLRLADLEGANLTWADLRWANLRGANLEGANLIGADLEGADLEEADLREADLREADLRGANLREADLRGANLEGADITYNDFWVNYIKTIDGEIKQC
jgi:hypothetical protein